MIHIKKTMCVCAVILAVISRISPVFGAFEYIGLGWPAATANIKVLGQHPHQFVVNPALMESGLCPQISLSYQNPFQSLDLQAGSVTIYNSIWQRPYIHSLEYFGDEQYSELKFINGTTWKLEEGFRVGVTVNYHRLAITGFNCRQGVTLSLGSYAELSDQIKVGSVVEHAIQWGQNISLPQKFQMGGQYEMGPAKIVLALEKESALPVEACLGLLISSGSLLQIGVGYRDLSGMMSAGWRMRTQRISLHYACVMHPLLPVSHGFGLELILP
ncbi:MAG: hypothetical protein HOB84_11510 [Candidatus Marinimicrobia bacterium]|jgi:hypothetical protein|nr:hypothetical protein [Candidatus Neomarinimicrobiota bacterium]MBT4360246.1 hypothetical protein [Candidatus Neomarinimicrobiota bacterium]MBT4715388.1 hypothetical protein [Candidatus Neomarinimicrobiota bacterium]MBT4946834.1 hypothetical protein [Candidatus Neomarinimicrobiota bacterium]MBT5270239.1 hypothetical protein [Candidatus Neomarinimicrobiota bacterium]